MATGKEQMEDQHREAEVVVIRGAHHPAICVGHLRWLILGRPHVTGELLAAIGNLEAVAVDEPAGGVLRHQKIGVVDVADDHAGPMHGVKGASSVCSSGEQKAPVAAGEMLKPHLRVVEIPERQMALEFRHDKADELAIRLMHRVDRLASADVVEIQGDTVCVVAVQSGVVIGPVG